MSDGTVVNIADVPLKERGNGKQFAFKAARVGPLVGLSGLGCTVHVVPPGRAAYPFHRHHVTDELFFVLSGAGEYRLGDKTLPLKGGDIVGAPAGGAAHQIINTGSEELRYLAVSTIVSADIVEYPDSGKIGVAAGIKNADFRSATYAGMGRLKPADYYDGEDAASATHEKT